MNKRDFEAKLASIQEVEPTPEDMEAIRRIKSCKDKSTISKDELDKEITYNGRVSLRLPKSLHEELVHEAKEEGISLNQFILYKLAK